ncbi:hypothetical protein H5410_059864 [Solanum commersonii]|uniref:Uncharacterized protein n=1 Tax=Solanum commersonii TaxID=4109 RepID=A0A9J5W3N7_SOLCO|nr:hypothetical protein H5410_059864 [Solanum commersonii]
MKAHLWMAFNSASTIMNEYGRLNWNFIIRNDADKVVVSCTNASPNEIVSTLVNIYNESFEAPA